MHQKTNTFVTCDNTI